MVHGDALGGGFETVLSCDVVIAERGAKFGLPEVLFNLFPGMGAYSLLCRRLDGARAQKLMLSGRIYTAEELEEMGLVDLVVEPGEGPMRCATISSATAAATTRCARSAGCVSIASR